MEETEEYQAEGTYDFTHEEAENSSHNKGGIIHITANIINEAEVTKDERVEFQGIPITDFLAIGYVIDYRELDSKVKIILWDYTGTIEINFSNALDKSSHIQKFHYDGTKKPVRIFGTIKVYKNEKYLHGGKILQCHSNEVLSHKADVIDSWLYLTGKINELKEMNLQEFAEEAKNLANKGGNFNNKSNSKNIEANKIEKLEAEAKKILEKYSKKESTNQISKEELENLFKKFGSKAEDIINKLIGDNQLIESEGGYEIL